MKIYSENEKYDRLFRTEAESEKELPAVNLTEILLRDFFQMTESLHLSLESEAELLSWFQLYVPDPAASSADDTIAGPKDPDAQDLLEQIRLFPESLSVPDDARVQLSLENEILDLKMRLSKEQDDLEEHRSKLRLFRTVIFVLLGVVLLMVFA